jgi:hypothetical protein
MQSLTGNTKPRNRRKKLNIIFLEPTGEADADVILRVLKSLAGQQMKLPNGKSRTMVEGWNIGEREVRIDFGEGIVEALGIDLSNPGLLMAALLQLQPLVPQVDAS